MRLIDADALKEKVEKYRIVHLSHRRLSAIKREAEEVINDICLGIDSAPTINPVKQGRWIHDGKRFESGVDWMHCSECGNTDAFGAKSMYHYCPNCGARMMEEEDENESNRTS